MSVEFEVTSNIARITINRPERRNAVDTATADQLEKIWSQIESVANWLGYPE